MMLAGRERTATTSSCAARACSTRSRKSTRSLDVRIDDGVIAQIGEASTRTSTA